MENFEIRHTTMDDYTEILKIYERARQFMAEHDNPRQWNTKWPPAELVKEDIELGRNYVCVLRGENSQLQDFGNYGQAFDEKMSLDADESIDEKMFLDADESIDEKMFLDADESIDEKMSPDADESIDEKIVAVFVYLEGEDPTYIDIVNGNWLDDSNYGVIHRLAVSGKVKGAASFAINWAYEKLKHLRVDTHEDNYVMQNLLKKLGFVRTGTIFVREDHDPRLAYEKSEKL